MTGHLEARGQTLRPTEMPECGASGMASLSRAVTVQGRVCLPRRLAEFLRSELGACFTVAVCGMGTSIPN